MDILISVLNVAFFLPQGILTRVSQIYFKEVITDHIVTIEHF